MFLGNILCFIFHITFFTFQRCMKRPKLMFLPNVCFFHHWKLVEKLQLMNMFWKGHYYTWKGLNWIDWENRGCKDDRYDRDTNPFLRVIDHRDPKPSAVSESRSGIRANCWILSLSPFSFALSHNNLPSHVLHTVALRRCTCITFLLRNSFWVKSERKKKSHENGD